MVDLEKILRVEGYGTKVNRNGGNDGHTWTIHWFGEE